MWFLNFLPDSWLHIFVHATVITGVVVLLVGKLARHIPTIETYGEILKLVGSIIFLFGIYFEGSYITEMGWRAKEADLKHQIELVQEKSNTANVQIQYKVVTQIKTIHDTKVVVHEKLKEAAGKIDAECKLAPEAIQVLNQSAKNPTAQVIVTGVSK